MSAWPRVRRGSGAERELDVELRFHFDAAVDANVRSGMPEAEARRRALIQFGGLDQVKEDCRDARPARWVDAFVQDLRFAFRLFNRHRTFAIAAIAVLALGVGVNGLFFTLVEMFCIRGPLDEPNRVVSIASTDRNGRAQGLSYPEFMDLKAGSRTLDALSAFATAPMSVADEARPADRISGAYISAGAFQMFGIEPMLGRNLDDEDDRPGAQAVALISERMWTQRFDGDPSILGRTIRVNREPISVIGVMPERFRFPGTVDLWQPLARMPQLASQPRDARRLEIAGLLAAGRTEEDARGEMEAVAGRFSREHPATNDGVRLTVVPLNAQYNGNIGDPAWIAFITAGVLALVIACANVANLLLMRATRRTREIAVRASLGASRWRVVRQLLVESTALALFGGTVGLGLAAAGLQFVARLTPRDSLSYWIDFMMDSRILSVVVAMCLGTGLLFGLVPALHLSRADLHGLLKDGGRADVGGTRGRRWTAVFVTSQLSLAMVLLVTLAFGTLAQLAQERRQKPSFDPSRLLTLSLTLPERSYGTPAERVRFYERLESGLSEIRAVTAASIASALPLSGAFTRQLVIDGRPAAGGPLPTVSAVAVGSGYFDALDLPAIRGRALDERDGVDGQASVVVNQRFVELHFPREDPLGRRVQLAQESPTETAIWFTIVGIAPTVRQRALPEADPVVYFPYRIEPPASASLIVRGPGLPASIASVIREKARSLDPDLPLYRVMTLEQALDEVRWVGRVSNVLATLLTCIAVGLSAVGLYAVTTYDVARRTSELGLRIALGARPLQVRWLVLRRTLARVAVAVAGGVAAAMALRAVFGPELADPINLTMGAVLLVVVSAAATVVPVQRATRLDPVAALRHE